MKRVTSLQLVELIINYVCWRYGQKPIGLSCKLDRPDVDGKKTLYVWHPLGTLLIKIVFHKRLDWKNGVEWKQVATCIQHGKCEVYVDEHIAKLTCCDTRYANARLTKDVRVTSLADNLQTTIWLERA